MHKITTYVFLTAIILMSCENKQIQSKNIEITKQYFKVLNHAEPSKVMNWLANSLKITEEEYRQTYSKNEYSKVLQWDSVFTPNYRVLNIEEKDAIVNVKISKIDQRISFLHDNEPFVTNHQIKFHEGKIVEIATDYVNFNYAAWEKNKTELLSYINQNHPELNGFLNDLTKDGGIKFLKAITFYNNKK